MGVDRNDGSIRLSEKERKAIRSRIDSARAYWQSNDRLRGVDRNYFQSESERNLALVAGDYWHTRRPNSEIFSINHVASALSVKHAVVTGGDTVFITKAREQRFLPIEETAKSTLNHLWDILGFDEECDRAEYDTYIHPTGGVVEIGWAYESDDGTELRGDREFDTEEALAEAAMPQDALPVLVGGEYADLSQTTVTEFQTEDEAKAYAAMAWDADIPRAKRDDPFIERFDPRDLFVDPQCTSSDLHDARFVFRRRLQSLSSVKASSQYRNTKDIKGASYGYYQGRDDTVIGLKTPPESVKDDLTLVELYDGYVFVDVDNDRREELVHVVFASEGEKELLAEYAPYPWFERRCRNPFPFEIIPGTTPDNDEYRCVPDVSKCRDVQVTHDLAYTQIEYKRAHTPDILVAVEGMFDGDGGQDTKRRIESGQQNTVLEVNAAYLDGLRWLDRPRPNEDAYKSLTEAPDKIRQIIGISDYQGNQLPEKDVTATEASYLASQGGTRQSSEIERYNRFLARCAYKVLILLQQFQERTRQYAFINNNGDEDWGWVNAEKLRGIVPGSNDSENPLGDLEEPGIQFAIDIDPSKKLPTNQLQERKTALELLTTLHPFTQMPDPRLPNRPLVNLAPLLRGIIETFDLSNQSEIIKPDPTPDEVKQAQAEMISQQQAQLPPGVAGMVNPTGAQDNNPPPGVTGGMQ